jgi:hypothetical protein
MGERHSKSISRGHCSALDGTASQSRATGPTPRRTPERSTVAAHQGDDMNELWSRSVASVYDGKVEDFKRLAGIS